VNLEDSVTDESWMGDWLSDDFDKALVWSNRLWKRGEFSIWYASRYPQHCRRNLFLAELNDLRLPLIMWEKTW
jgi:hypothetical protein